MLRGAGRTLKGSLWKTGFVGRWSEDQFRVIVNGGGEVALRSVGERVRRVLASNGLEWWGERRSLPVSFGQAAAQPGDSVEPLLDRAQKSLAAASALRAHAAGGNHSGS